MTFTIQGIPFFNTPSLCIDHFEKSHWSEKAISLVKSFGTFFVYYTSIVYRNLFLVKNPMSPLTEANGEFLKRKLIVCVHGLNRNPSQFKEIIDEVQKKDL